MWRNFWTKLRLLDHRTLVELKLFHTAMFAIYIFKLFFNFVIFIAVPPLLHFYIWILRFSILLSTCIIMMWKEKFWDSPSRLYSVSKSVRMKMIFFCALHFWKKSNSFFILRGTFISCYKSFTSCFTFLNEEKFNRNAAKEV